MSDTDENMANKDVPPWLQPVPDAEESKGGLAGSRRTMIAAGVAVTLVVVFIAALVFLYEGTPPPPRVVTADTSDIRKKPDEPGGMDVDHQDKKIFEAADGSAPVSRVELSPRTEQPLEEIPNLQTNNAAEDTETSETEDKIGDIAAAALRDEPATRSETPDSVQIETSRPAPSEPEKTAPAATPQPVATETPAATTGQYSVQLGAYGTQQSAATAWRTVRGKFPAQLGELQPIYVAVEAGNRTLYRLRAGPVANRDDADAICIALRAQEQGCFVANP